MSFYIRPYLSKLHGRMSEPRRFIQVVLGPRQVGKTTLVRQLLNGYKSPARYHNGDDAPRLASGSWLDTHWQQLRLEMKQAQQTEALLVIDEVQRVSDWSVVVKKNWDLDTIEGRSIKLILLGSAQLLLQKGLGESLAGRFEVTYLPQWSYGEMRDAFGFSHEDYVWFGGYPGSAALIGDEARWKSYIREAIIHPAVQQDIISLTRVDKPVLLAQLFELACQSSGQIVSLQKLTGQLQDVGNVTTLAHYLNILDSAGFVRGLQKYSAGAIRRRSAPPKLQVHDNALMTALLPVSKSQAQMDPSSWGRLVESAVGAHLLSLSRQESCNLYYWRESPHEVDFVVAKGLDTVAIEVKTGKTEGAYAALDRFRAAYPDSRPRLVSAQPEFSWKVILEEERIFV